MTGRAWQCASPDVDLTLPKFSGLRATTQRPPEPRRLIRAPDSIVERGSVIVCVGIVRRGSVRSTSTIVCFASDAEYRRHPPRCCMPAPVPELVRSTCMHLPCDMGTSVPSRLNRRHADLLLSYSSIEVFGGQKSVQSAAILDRPDWFQLRLWVYYGVRVLVVLLVVPEENARPSAPLNLIRSVASHHRATGGECATQ